MSPADVVNAIRVQSLVLPAGMSMLGKMSVGVRAMVSGSTIRINNARTTNV